MTDRLDAIRQRAEKATPGPWWQGPHYKADVDSGRGNIRANCWTSQQAIADAEFIAHAREDVPFLLAEIDTLHQRLQTAEQKAKRATDALARMNLVDDDMGIYMAGTHNPDGTFTPRTEFGDGWNAAVSQYGKALLHETFEMMDEGLVADLAGEADEEGYGPLVAFLRRAKKAEAERDAVLQRLATMEAERDRSVTP